jgi:Tfp pilus assembly protein PilN
VTHINLLPPEIREKRAAERRILVMIASGVAVLMVLLGVYVFLGILVGQEQGILASLENQNARTEQAIKEYQVFETQRLEVETKKKTVSDAIKGEIPWFKLLNELSLVIPSDVWLTGFTGHEVDGVQIQAQAVDSASDSPDGGHKPVAKWMVRLSEIPMLTEIWLASSAKGEGTVLFATTAKVRSPASPPSVTAPPSAPSTSTPTTSGASP